MSEHGELGEQGRDAVRIGERPAIPVLVPGADSRCWHPGLVPGAGSWGWFPVLVPGLVPMPCSLRQLHLAKSAGLPLETTGRYKPICPVRKDSMYPPSSCREAQDGWTCSPEG